MSYQAKAIYLMNPIRSSPPLQDSINSFNENYWLPFHNQSNDLIIYHYTTLNGLLGIIKNRSLWCSHIKTLNDPSELQYGKNLVTQQINAKFSEVGSDLIADFLNNIKSLVNAYEYMFHTLVGCFCEDGNLLSQWRNYSSQGGGYNLGLTINSDTIFSLNADNLDDNSFIILRKIIYRESDQILMITRCIESIINGGINTLKWFEEQKMAIPDAWGSIAANQAINILFDIILSIKNPVFKKEKEWRIIKVFSDIFHQDIYKFRNNNEHIVPYLDTYIYNSIEDQKVFPLKSVTYGPMVDKKETESFIKLFLQNTGMASNDISINADAIVINGAGFDLRN